MVLYLETPDNDVCPGPPLYISPSDIRGAAFYNHLRGPRTCWDVVVASL